MPLSPRWLTRRGGLPLDRPQVSPLLKRVGTGSFRALRANPAAARCRERRATYLTKRHTSWQSAVVWIIAEHLGTQSSLWRLVPD